MTLARVARKHSPISGAAGHDPLLEPDGGEAAEGILREEFYGQPPRRQRTGRYKVVCISLYAEDIARLEALVAELRRRGHPRASKSALIRFALNSVDIDKMPNNS